MPDPTLTRERLDELEALEKAATPDIWGPGDVFPLFLYPKHGDDIGKFYRSEDTEFIAALRNDASALFAAARERDALKAKLVEAQRGWGNAIYQNEVEQREHEAVEDERDALKAKLVETMKQARECIALFASCIKSVEQWSDSCQTAHDRTRQALDAVMKPKESSHG